MAEEAKQRVTVTVHLDPVVYRLLQVLTHSDLFGGGSVEDVLLRLIDHAQQGVYRPGSWERGWLCQAFGDDWIAQLVPGDPHGRPDCERIFVRPRDRTEV
jgi:hypothetical protein